MSHDMRKSVFILCQRQMSLVDQPAIQHSLLGTLYIQSPESMITESFACVIFHAFFCCMLTFYQN